MRAEADELYRRALALQPDAVDVLCNLLPKRELIKGVLCTGPR